MDFKNKYFKYKKKYLNLKQKSFSQQGGSREEFFKKFNKINKGQIYKTKRKIGYRGEEQAIIIKITDKKDENTWLWELLKYKNNTDKQYDSDLTSLTDISNKDDIIFHQNSYPTQKRIINNSVEDKDNKFMVLNLEPLINEIEVFKIIELKIKETKLIKDKENMEEMVRKIFRDIKDGTYDINEEPKVNSNYYFFKQIYIDNLGNDQEASTIELAKRYLSDLIRIQKENGDKIEKRRSLIGKLVLIKRSNGDEEIWKIDNKIYSYGNRKENDSLKFRNHEGLEKSIKIYDEDFDKTILRLATEKEIEVYESQEKTKEDLGKLEDKQIFDKFVKEINSATDLNSLNKIEYNYPRFNYSRHYYKLLTDLLKKRREELS